MAPRRKHMDDFDEMKAKADSLREKVRSEGEETTLAARSFRKLVIDWLTLQMEMLIWLYQYVRANQAVQKEMDDEAMLTGAHEVLDRANGIGPRAMLPASGKDGKVPVGVADGGNGAAAAPDAGRSEVAAGKR